MSLGKVRAESRTLGVFGVMANMATLERHDSGLLQCHVHDEKESLCVEIDGFRAWVRLRVAACEGSTS